MVEKQEWVCPICDKHFFLFPYQIRQRKTCSYACRNKSPYHRKCNSESKKGKSIPWNKGLNGYTTSRQGMKHSKETKIKMSENHFVKKDRETHRANYFKSGINKPTKYEMTFAKYLDKLNIKYKQQVTINNKYQVDFLLCDNIIVEIDGDWHYKRGGLRMEDIERDKTLNELGYKVLHIKNQEAGCNV